jgi:hypothetical protein
MPELFSYLARSPCTSPFLVKRGTFSTCGAIPSSDYMTGKIPDWVATGEADTAWENTLDLSPNRLYSPGVLPGFWGSAVKSITQRMFLGLLMTGEAYLHEASPWGERFIFLT